jgi:hypothetical protein
MRLQEGTVLVQIQSKNEYPNYYLRNIFQKKINSNNHIQNPFESIKT